MCSSSMLEIIITKMEKCLYLIALVNITKMLSVIVFYSSFESVSFGVHF